MSSQIISNVMQRLVKLQVDDTMSKVSMMSGMHNPPSVSLPLFLSEMLSADKEAYRLLILEGSKLYINALGADNVVTTSGDSCFKLAATAIFEVGLVLVYPQDSEPFVATLSLGALNQLRLHGQLKVPDDKWGTITSRYGLTSQYIWSKLSRARGNELCVLKLSMKDNNGTPEFVPNVNATTIQLNQVALFPLRTWKACAETLYGAFLSRGLCKIEANGRTGYYTYDENLLRQVHSAVQVNQMLSCAQTPKQSFLGRLIVPRLGASQDSLGVRNLNIGDIDRISFLQLVPNDLLSQLSAESNVDISQTREQILEYSDYVSVDIKQSLLYDITSLGSANARLSKLGITQDRIKGFPDEYVLSVFNDAIALTSDSVLYDLLSTNAIYAKAFRLDELKRKKCKYGTLQPVNIKNSSGGYYPADVLRVLYSDSPVRIIYRTSRGNVIPIICTKNLTVLDKYVNRQNRLMWENEGSRLKGMREYIEAICQQQGVSSEDVLLPNYVIADAAFTWGISNFISDSEKSLSVGEVFARIDKRQDSVAEERLLRYNSRVASGGFDNNIVVRCVNALCAEDYIRTVDVTKIVQIDVYRN